MGGFTKKLLSCARSPSQTCALRNPIPCCPFALSKQGQGPSEGVPEREELPFPNIPKPDYEAERPQEQTAPEPDNPLPPDLPPNWRPDEVREQRSSGCTYWSANMHHSC